MTASLYQRARSSERCSSEAVCSTSLISLSPDNTEDMRRQGLRIELHEIAPAGPGVDAAAQQVAHFVGQVLSPADIQPAGLHVARIEVHHQQDQIVAQIGRA